MGLPRTQSTYAYNIIAICVEIGKWYRIHELTSSEDNTQHNSNIKYVFWSAR